MKNSYLSFAMASLAFACAAQPPNEGQPSGQAPPAMYQMQGQMQTMQALMGRIHDTEDPQERQRLMREHMQSMQQGMTMMGQMMRGQGGVPGQPRECAQGDTECRMQRMQGQQQMMNQRMSMMQMMMEQMMGQMTQRDAEEPATRPDDENREPND